MTKVFISNHELLPVDKSGIYLPKQLAFRLQQMWIMLRRYETKNKTHLDPNL